MESDDSDTSYYDDEDPIFNSNKYLHRLIFPNDPEYEDDYDENFDAARMLRTNMSMKSLYSQLNTFHNWELLPVEIRCLIIEKMDFMTRISLMITSKSNNEIVRCLPMVIDKIVVRKDTTPKPDTISPDEDHVCIGIPQFRLINNLTFHFVKSGEDTKVIREWFSTHNPKLVKKMTLLKNSDYIKESELFVERLLIFTNYRLNTLHVDILDWGQSLSFFDKLRVKNELSVCTYPGTHAARLLGCGSLSLSELSIAMTIPFQNTSFLGVETVKNAKKLTIGALALFSDSFLLDLKCEEIVIVTLQTTDHTINTFVKRWIDGGGPENFRQAEISSSYVLNYSAVLENIEASEWDEQFKSENDMLQKWALKKFPGSKYYYIESKKRNNGATLVIEKHTVAFLVTGKRWSSGVGRN